MGSNRGRLFCRDFLREVHELLLSHSDRETGLCFRASERAVSTLSSDRGFRRTSRRLTRQTLLLSESPADGARGGPRIRSRRSPTGATARVRARRVRPRTSRVRPESAAHPGEFVVQLNLRRFSQYSEVVRGPVRTGRSQSARKLCYVLQDSPRNSFVRSYRPSLMTEGILRSEGKRTGGCTRGTHRTRK